MEDETKQEDSVKVLIDQGDQLEVECEGKKYAFVINNLGWFLPEKIMEKHAYIEQDEREAHKRQIHMAFAEIELEIMRQGIAKMSVDGVEVAKSPDALKQIPGDVKDKVVAKAAPSFKKDKSKLKNLMRSSTDSKE